MKFEDLYSKYNKVVFNLALNYVQNREDAEEITQDTFVSIHFSIDSFQEKSQLLTWIYRITINKSLDFIKAKKRKKRFAVFTDLFTNHAEEINHGAHNFDHPGVQMEQKEEISKLYSFINQLPENQKTALILSKLDGKSQKEIADIMLISPKAVESLIQRAKVNLQKKLNQTRD